jgi:hypothetical protein
MKATWVSWLLVTAVLGVAGTAGARDVWTDPYPGVRHLHRATDSIDVHALIVDLSSGDISLVATRPRDRSMPVREFAHRYGVDIAVNANYFDTRSKSCGLAAGDGVVWADSYDDGCDMSIGFGRQNEAMAFDSGDLIRGPVPEAWMTDVITGKPWVVRHGVAQGGWLEPRHIEGHHPRTAVGLSQDRRTLFIVVADGRRAGIPGVTGHYLARLMLELGAWDALNLDGGGSSEMFIRAENGVVNQPSDNRPRPVGNHLGIRVRRSARWASFAPESPPASEPATGPSSSLLYTPGSPAEPEVPSVEPSAAAPAPERPSIRRERARLGTPGSPLAWLGTVLASGALSFTGVAVTVRRRRA